ncbi:MAG: NAD(P)-binding oxidoreductase [Lamprobacter sp.]|uniref:NAD(P)-dependent oxidoreductase n=1 Tax=Lamprobacter sp. TaxID=3100796 RepID=UPI002B25AD88|nr:NAD(P)-binding oxidoreductase [Lamprobacter sp.]MEA3639404.1 NAD(P)-binding oxidoreductase [Lamprobacter sp.]
MKIALFGATGGTGRQVLSQGLAKGDGFHVLARSPETLQPATDLEVIAGDVLDQAAVDRCLTGTDAVICVLGSHGSAEPVEADGTERIIAGMQRLGINRLVAVTSMGVGDSREQVPGFFRVIMQLTLKKIMAAKERQEQLIRESGLDWTIVRPGGLTDGPATGSYLSGTDKSIKATRISRADVADFVLQQLRDDRYLHQAPSLS